MFMIFCRSKERTFLYHLAFCIFVTFHNIDVYMRHRVYTGRVRCCTIKLDAIIINYSIKVLSHLPLLNWSLQKKLFCQLANKPTLHNCFLNRCFLHLVIVLKYSVIKKWLNRKFTKSEPDVKFTLTLRIFIFASKIPSGKILKRVDFSRNFARTISERW